MPEMPALPENMRWAIVELKSVVHTHALCLQAEVPGAPRVWATFKEYGFEVSGNGKANARTVVELANLMLAEIDPPFADLTGFHMNGKSY
ncbi:hypothetical protein SEA_DATBOI_45 [Gordonia phage DatBoi]|nr:hypothetical protein SEA_DATBOI_45 [Gordonia phage DatBoi]